MTSRLLDWLERVIMGPPRISIWDPDAPDCTCGHVADVHRHYRDGHDCSQCDCRTYTPKRTP